ncbi:ornithine cyclodeaminase [Sulfurospirillum sp. 1612]|uniref:ornithine cyclodeaminase n=1 Tax=Sulfurospirillum sp. 1612 TaxID=3094835 RepID=UPI002F958643
MLVLDVYDIRAILDKVGFQDFFLKLITTLEHDYKNWDHFDKMPRIATHFSYGVLELMPTSDEEYYGYKYVTGHPQNPTFNKTTVMATGQLSTIDTGEPVMISEMTLLTALRTGATSAMAGKYLARKDSKVLCLIGTGAQSEFQSLAFKTQFDIQEIRYFDIDPKAMDKFEKNIASFGFKLTRCHDAKEALKGADIVTTITADKKNQTILTQDMIEKGMFINGVGGDCPGKTEMDKEVLNHASVFIEYLPQTKIEGEIQQMPDDFPTTALHEVIKGERDGRKDATEVTLFDSVGFAIEDFSVLKLVYKLAKEYNIGKKMDMIPVMRDPKNLFESFTK